MSIYTWSLRMCVFYDNCGVVQGEEIRPQLLLMWWLMPLEFETLYNVSLWSKMNVFYNNCGIVQGEEIRPQLLFIHDKLCLWSLKL